MKQGGSDNSKTWHCRLRYLSNKKLGKMISSDSAPREEAGHSTAKCETCRLTHPKWRPVLRHCGENSLIWIDDTKLFFYPSTTTRVASSVEVKQLVIFAMLLSFLRIYQEWRNDLSTLLIYKVPIRCNNTHSLYLQQECV